MGEGFADVGGVDGVGISVGGFTWEACGGEGVVDGIGVEGAGEVEEFTGAGGGVSGGGHGGAEGSVGAGFCVGLFHAIGLGG